MSIYNSRKRSFHLANFRIQLALYRTLLHNATLSLTTCPPGATPQSPTLRYTTWRTCILLYTLLHSLTIRHTLLNYPFLPCSTPQSIILPFSTWLYLTPPTNTYYLYITPHSPTLRHSTRHTCILLYTLLHHHPTLCYTTPYYTFTNL